MGSALPGRAPAVGGALLVVNAALPIVYRELQEDRMGKGITWGPAYETNDLSWLAILPLLVAACLPLPKPASQARSLP